MSAGVLVPFFIPIVVSFVRDTGVNVVICRVRHVESNRLVLLDPHSTRGGLKFERALHHRQLCPIVGDLYAEIRRFRHLELSSTKGYEDFVLVIPFQVEVGKPLLDGDYSSLTSVVPESQLLEADDCLGSEAYGAPVLEFNLGSSVLAGLYAGALYHRHIRNRPLETLTGCAIDFHVAIYVTQPDYANLGICYRLQTAERRDYKEPKSPPARVFHTMPPRRRTSRRVTHPRV